MKNKNNEIRDNLQKLFDLDDNSMEALSGEKSGDWAMNVIVGSGVVFLHIGDLSGDSVSHLDYHIIAEDVTLDNNGKLNIVARIDE